MGDLTQSGLGYMKGKTRHWFWPALAVLLITAVLQYAVNILIGRLTHVVPDPALIAGTTAISVVLSAGMAAVLLAYALANRVNIYKALFIILACTQLFSLTGESLSYYTIVSAYSGRQAGAVVPILVGLSSAIGSLAWLVCLLIVAFGKPASPMLRASSILLAAFFLFSLIYGLFLQRIVVLSLYRNLDMPAATAINSVISISQSVIRVALHAFFFGTMSFSLRRSPAAKQAAAT